jgi:hypothetical protein
MQLTTRNTTENDPYEERRIREMDVKLTNPVRTSKLKSSASPVGPLLIIATSSFDAAKTCQSVDVFAYSMAEHICALFRFNRGGDDFGNACENGLHLRALSGKLLALDAPP